LIHFRYRVEWIEPFAINLLYESLLVLRIYGIEIANGHFKDTGFESGSTVKIN